MYAYCEGNPVNGVDPSGLILMISPYATSYQKQQILDALNVLIKSNHAYNMLKAISASPCTYYINPNGDSFTPVLGHSGGVVHWDPAKSYSLENLNHGKDVFESVFILAHELGHAYDNLQYNAWKQRSSQDRMYIKQFLPLMYRFGFTSMEEVHNILYNERQIEKELNHVLRYYY